MTHRPPIAKSSWFKKTLSVIHNVSNWKPILIPTKIAASSRQLVKLFLSTKNIFEKKLILQTIPKIILNFLTEWIILVSFSHQNNDIFHYYS